MKQCTTSLVAVAAMLALGSNSSGQVEDSVSNLVKNLAEKDEETRIEACKALGRKGAKAKKAVPALAGALQDTSEDVRGFALAALTQIGEASLEALPAIQKSLADDKSVLIRSLAAETIGSLGPKAKDAVPSLIKAMKDPDAGVKTRAVHALGKMGAESTTIRPVLLDAMADPALAGVAAASLARMGKDVLPDLAKLLEGNDETARVHAVLALRVIGGADVVPMLTKALDDKSDSVRSQALDALGRMNELARPALGKMTEMLADKSSGDAAAAAVAKFGKDSLPGIVKTLSHADEHARINSVLALRQLSLPEVVEPLVSALKDKSPKVRVQAVQALGNLGGPAKSALGEIEKLQGDADADVKKAVETALERLRS